MRHVLLFQLPGKLFISHAACLLLRIDRARDFVFGGQKLFLLGPLEKDFALNQLIEDRQPRLRQFVRRHLRFLALRLLVNDALDLVTHDLLAVDGRGHGVIGGFSSRAAAGQRQRAEQNAASMIKLFVFYSLSFLLLQVTQHSRLIAQCAPAALSFRCVAVDPP